MRRARPASLAPAIVHGLSCAQPEPKRGRLYAQQDHAPPCPQDGRRARRDRIRGSVRVRAGRQEGHQGPRFRDLRGCREGGSGRLARLLLPRERGGHRRDHGRLRQGLPEDQDQLCARADRRALQQDRLGALRRPLRCRRAAAFRRGARDRFREARRLRGLHRPVHGRVQEGLSERDARQLFLDRRDLRGARLQQEQGHRRGHPEDLPGHQQPALPQQDLLQDFVVRHPVRAVVPAAPDPRQRFLEGIRQAAPARLRLARAAVRPARQRRRRHDGARRVFGLHALQDRAARTWNSSPRPKGWSRRR